MRILVVDDHEFIRRGIRAVLATAPSLTCCGEAIDGRDAVEKAKALRPDIVVMDISMPNMNGLEATRKSSASFPSPGSLSSASMRLLKWFARPLKWERADTL